MNPKVFVSHASEDKERFVINFATKLRAKGIDAWLDKWEILPGDSLIDKIFEEGIKDAQAIIVVVSQHSVDKKWVREELNAAIVKKINGISKLIPVVIDDCQVPEALQSTVWEKIKDLNSYDAKLDSIVRAIYEHRERPPLGAPPAYTQISIPVIQGLTKVDSLILKLSCETAIEIADTDLIDVEIIFQKAKSFNISQEAFFESLEIFEKRGHIVAFHTDEREAPYRFGITTFGFNEYASVYIKEYKSIIDSVMTQIVNLNNKDNASIIKSLNQPQVIIDHILKLLQGNGLMQLMETDEGFIHVIQVSAELRRMLRMG